MAKRNRLKPVNHPHSSFDSIGVGGSAHLRLVDDDVNVAPYYEDAELMFVSGKPGQQIGSFWIPSLKQTISGISEAQYTAWTRY